MKVVPGTSPFLVRAENNIRLVAEKAMAPYSSTFAWKIPWMEEEPGQLQSMDHKELDMTERLLFIFFLFWK